MGLRCKKGDMAIVIKSIKGRHVGHFVDVAEFLGEEAIGSVWLVKGNTLSRSPRIDGLWACPDSWLLPIRPDELKEGKEKEVTA